MKITLYGAKPEPDALGILLSYIPEDAKEVIVKVNARKPLGIRPCQFPGGLFYDASVDNKLFLYLIQEGPDQPITVKQTQ